MPKSKSGKKSKNSDQKNSNVRDEKAKTSSKSSHAKDSISCVCGESSRDSSEQRKSLVEALVASPILSETSQKSQMKRQKRKNKKHNKGLELTEHVEEICQLPTTVWETVETIKNFEECTAKINEDAIKITEVEVVDDLERELFNSSPLMNEEEEKTLREFLKTLEIVDGQKESSTKRKRSFSDGNEYEPIEYSNGNKTVVETIPEEIFEEFLENEEIKKAKEAIKSRGVSKSSPRSSPKSKRKTQTSSLKIPPKNFIATSPKMLYSYNGVPFDEPSTKPCVTIEDFDDAIAVINNFPRERKPGRRLDVIIEENSDFSDASEMKTETKKTRIDRRGKIFDDGVKNFDFQMQPVVKETVKIFPLDKKIKESVIIEESDEQNNNCYSVEPVVMETLKMSEDVVKIELPESETENEVEIEREEAQNESQVEIVYLDDNGELLGNEFSEDENSGFVGVSMSSFISDADIKFIEDESESLGSSGNRDEGEDGTEADVESELDSKRATRIMEEIDDDFDFDFDNPFLPENLVPSKIKLEPSRNDKKEAYEETTETALPEEKMEEKDSEVIAEIIAEIEHGIEQSAQKELISEASSEPAVQLKSEMLTEKSPVQQKEQIERVTTILEEQPRKHEEGSVYTTEEPIEKKPVEETEELEKPKMTTDEILHAVQLNLEKLKNSPSYSRQESTSSCASNSYNTAKYLPPFSRSASEPGTFKTVSEGSFENGTNDPTAQESVSIIASPLNEEDRTLSEADSLIHDDVSDGTSDFEMKMRKNNSKSEIAELKKRKNVQNIVGTMEKNINEILRSKLKVIECFEEPIMSEATWLKILEMTKREIKSGEAEKSTIMEENNKLVEPMGISKSGEVINQNPDSLTDLAERKMLSLPYGWLVLKKIGLCRCCSGKNHQGNEEIQTKQKETKKNGGKSYFDKISLSESDSTPEMKLNNLQCWSDVYPRSASKSELWHPPTPPPSPYVEFMSATDKWYGMPVGDSDLLLGLSSSQKKEFEKKAGKKMSNEREAAFLLDLHQKFLERRCYHEANPLQKDRRIVFDSENTEPDFPVVEINKVEDEINDFSKDGVANEIEIEGARKFEIEKKSRLVGNDSRLAISQNATSDDFIPELNINCSAGSSCESHEVSFVQNQAAMFDIWQKQRKFGSTSKNSEEVCRENNNFLGKQDIPNKPNRQDDESLAIEEKYQPGQREILSGLRQKMVGSNNGKNISINNDKFLKEYQNSKRIVQEKESINEENQILVEKQPTVSDIIKNFESNGKENELNHKNSLKSIAEKYHISKKGDIALIQNGENGYDRRRIQDLVHKERRKSVPISNLSEEEVFKQKMYEEYMSKLAERVERRQQKAIKMSQTNEMESPEEPKFLDIENEFISKVKERNDKLKMLENENPNIMFESFEKKCQEFTTFWERQYSDLESLRKRQVRRSSSAKDEFDRGTMTDTSETTSSKRSGIQLILDTTSDVAGLPKHLQEFLQIEEDDLADVNIDFQSNRKGRKVKSAEHCNNCRKQKDNLLKEIDDALVLGKGFLFSRGTAMLTPTFKATAPRPGVWSPAQPPPEEKPEEKEENKERKKLEDEPIPPVWTPKSAQASPVAERKEFRPVNFESPTLPRKKYIQEVRRSERSAFQPVDCAKNEKPSAIPPWQQQGGDKTPEIVKTPGSPGLSLPRAPNPTVTLLQKAREGHLPKGAHYLSNNMTDSYSDSEHRIHRNEVYHPSFKDDSERSRKIEIIPKLPVQGIGPTTKEGIPVVLRSEVTEENKEKWYKRMYESLHKAGKDEDYVTVKYRTSPSRKGGFSYQAGSSSGYQSEPENLAYDSNRQINKYQTLDRRRSERDKENDYISVTLPRSRASTPRYETYKNQPGRIEDYQPGHSSISELEARQWWDEVLEIFDRWLERNPDAQGPGARKLLTDAIQRRRQEERSVPVHKTESPKSFMTYALKDAGYLSDPQHVIKRREENFQSSLSPQEQKEAYRIIQKGGEVPLRGLRKPAPERPKDDTEIEYFPLSPTLTRIRVHKQNITPLSEFPFLTFPVSYQTTTYNYPNYPIGVCNSFSQVQVFPPPPPPPSQQSKKKNIPETVYTKKGSHYQFSRNPDLLKKDQKFSVQLQNISGVDDYIHIVPQPRTTPKKVHDYVNLPLRSQSCSPRPWSPKREISPLSFCSETCSTSYKRTVSPEKRITSPVDAPVFPSRGNICGSFFTPEQKKPELATFSDLKRIAPSIVPKTIFETPCFGKVIHNKPKEKKEHENKSTKSVLVKKSESVKPRSDLHKNGDKDKSVKKQSVKKSVSEKNRKIPERKVLVSRNRISPDKKVPDISKKITRPKSKVPLSESVQREKPLSKTNKRKTISSKEVDTKKTFKIANKEQSDSEKSSIDPSKQDIFDYLSRFVESQLGSGYIELQSSEENNTESCTVEESGKETDGTMNPIYDSVNPNFGTKRKVEPDITEVFRSRSFSPDVRKKIVKPPDKNVPIPPKRKSSKNNSTLRMWSKMMVSYPYHRSRLDSFDSNVKFLRDRLKRRLDRRIEDKENESEFGDDIETVRTVRRDKNGSMSIKTNRYVKISRPISSSPITPTRTYDEHGRRVISEPRTKTDTSDSSKARRSSDASTVSKSTDLDVKRAPAKPKGLDTVVRSSTTYSVRSPANQEEDKRKSVKVTVAISSKGKEVLRKSASLTSPKKGFPPTKSSSSPCPSASSYRSGLSARSLLSEKGSSTTSPGRGSSPQSRVLSPNSSVSRISSPSRSISPSSTIISDKQKSLKSRTEIKTQLAKKLVPSQSNAPITLTFSGSKDPSKSDKKFGIKKLKETVKIPTITKSPGKKLLAQMSSLTKSPGSKEDLKKKGKKTTKNGDVGKKLKKSDNGKNKISNEKKKIDKKSDLNGRSDEIRNEVIEGTNLVRTNSFFQNLFLRGPPDKKPVNLERTSSVLERARNYQRSLERPSMHKSEPSLALVTFYLTQKKPVSSSKFKSYDRELSLSRSPSPFMGSRSQSFQMKLRQFDCLGEEKDFASLSPRGTSPDVKIRSSSEPPINRSQTNSPEDFKSSSRVAISETGSIRTSPTPSRSPSCRRIRSFKSSLRSVDVGRDVRKKCVRARSAGGVDDMRPNSFLGAGSSLAQSTSSLNLSNLSDHAEYQAYVLELMHSTKKCERFRELHKFYSSLERMGELEKTASIGDLRPRMKNEEIIDYDRWKKLRTKERAEAELKTLVGKLTEIQKEKDLVFRTADVEAVRWKGDRGLRIKERSVEDLKEQFIKYAQEEACSDSLRKRDVTSMKDNYKPLWRGSSIVNLATSLNTTLASHRGRPVTIEDLQKIEAAKERIVKKLGTKSIASYAFSSLSNDQVHALKNQLSEIYGQELKKKGFGFDGGIPENCEITVPEKGGVKSPREKGLYVRCNSLLSKDQMYLPSVKKKEKIREETKKAESISALPNWKSKTETEVSDRKVGLLELPWKDEPREFDFTRTQSEDRSGKHERHSAGKARSASSTSKPLSENEKKRLSMTLSKEVLEKVMKPRETLGSYVTGGKSKKSGTADSNEGTGSPRTCYSLEMSEDGKSKSDFLLVLTPTEKGKDVEKVVEEWANGNSCRKENERNDQKLANAVSTTELESVSASSETSVKTVITKNPVEVLKKVEYFEDLIQNPNEDSCLDEADKSEGKKIEPQSKSEKKKSSEKKKTSLISSRSFENLKDLLGQERKYATIPFQKKQAEESGTVIDEKRPSNVEFVQIKSKTEEFQCLRKLFEDQIRFHSASPSGYRSIPSVSSNDSVFSFRSRSVSPDPTKYYRAYLRMVKCGAVRKLCNKFESWEDLICSSDKDSWLPPTPKRFASDPELTRDMLRRYGTDPTKVTVRGQEVGDVRWLRTKYERNSDNPRGRSRYRRGRVASPVLKNPISTLDRFMPRINVISKTAELQLQKLNSEYGRRSPDPKSKDIPLPSRYHEMAASPEPYRSLIDYTKEHGGYFYTGEVEKLRRKFEKLHEAEKLSILGQMYTSNPEVNELRDIAPYLGCSWVAHRYPGVTKTASSPDLHSRRQESCKQTQTKPRPHSSSPIRPKQPCSILKPSYPYPDKDFFADQKYDPSIHRPKYRYQPDADLDQRSKRGDTDHTWWKNWNKPTVTFKEPVDFDFLNQDQNIRDLTPDSARKYVESEVTIHYKSPVRAEAKAYLSEDELARRQAESMKRIYQEERRRKYLQELQDMNSRRHTDYFTPSQKSPIPLNRYDDFPFDHSLSYSPTRFRDSSSEPVLVARGLYDFCGRRPRELQFRRGDVIFIIKRLDKNWCEGEINGAVGLFPLSYVEIIPYNEVNPKYGRARAKYDFIPQTSLELLARKGDMITLIRRIDENWFEGRIGERTGIIPTSYCHVLVWPRSTSSRLPVRQEKSKPVASPAAHSLIHNGKVPTKHSYIPWYSGPNSPGPSTASSAASGIANLLDGHTNINHRYGEAHVNFADEDFATNRPNNKTSAMQPLNISINPRSEPALYQVLFNHIPNNDDELELVQGETVLVVEKCEDGWYVGSNPMTGKIGIFPGNHVQRMSPEFV